MAEPSFDNPYSFPGFGAYTPEEDELMLAFGVPPDAFAVRPAIRRVVVEAEDLRRRDRAAAAATAPARGGKAYRCVVKFSRPGAHICSSGHTARDQT